MVQDALPHGEAAGARRPRLDDVGAEEALEEIAGIGDGGQGLGLGLPGDVVAVGAGVAVIAVAGLAGFLESDFERRQFGKVAVGVGGELVGGDAELEIGSGGAVDLDAGHVGGEGAAVVAGADEERTAPVGV